MEPKEGLLEKARSKAVFGILLVIFYIAGGLGLRFLYDHRHSLFGSWFYYAALIIYVMVTMALVVIGGVIWWKSRNSPITSDDSNDMGKTDGKEERKEEPLKKEKTRLQKVADEIFERIKIEGPIFLLLLVIFNGLALWWFTDEFRHLGSMPAYWVGIVLVSLAILLRKAFRESPGLTAFGILVLVLVVAGFVKQGLGEYREYKIAREKDKPSVAISVKDGVYPLPENLPEDTTFLVTARKGVWTPRIVTPVGYTVLWTKHSYDQTHNYTMGYHLSGKLHEVVFGPFKPKVMLPPGNDVLFKAHLDSTRFWVRVKKLG